MGRKRKPEPTSYCVVCGATVFSEEDCVCGNCKETYGSSDNVIALQNKVRILEDELADAKEEYYRLSKSISKSLKSIEKSVAKEIKQ